MRLSSRSKIITARKQYPKKTITISGPEDQVKELEKLLLWIKSCCSIGHSASAKISVDGDGAADLDFEGIEKQEFEVDESDPELSVGIG